MKLNNNDDSHNSGLNLLIYNMLLDIESHPTWVCGLKLKNVEYGKEKAMSHPTWVCGLKRKHTHKVIFRIIVTPYVGVWIETLDGLGNYSERIVTPYVGVWIETCLHPSGLKAHPASHPTWVCGLKLDSAESESYRTESHPTWVCGLKHRLIRPSARTS